MNCLSFYFLRSALLAMRTTEVMVVSGSRVHSQQNIKFTTNNIYNTIHQPIPLFISFKCSIVTGGKCSPSSTNTPTTKTVTPPLPRVRRQLAHPHPPHPVSGRLLLRLHLWRLQEREVLSAKLALLELLGLLNEFDHQFVHEGDKNLE